jgi:23S rRNA (adenine2503-C2)-methyltransferase
MRLDELAALFEGMNQPSYRATQVFEGLYRHRWDDWNKFTNLPKGLRSRLSSEATIVWPEIDKTLVSADGSAKHRLRLVDDLSIESVYMPFEKRATLCISTQVGCAMGCVFCATGAMGIKRNLSAAEIVGQVIVLLVHHGHRENYPINIVFMGMGEPLHNLEQVMNAFVILRHPKGLALPPRRVTISTAGLVPGIVRLGDYHPRPGLALSLNATTDEARSRIMPINSVWGLEKLARALEAFPLEPDERITLEYVLIKGYSDSMEDAHRLSKFASGFQSKINLIPYNPPAKPISEQCHLPNADLWFMPSDEERINRIGGFLADRGHVVSIRRSRGGDVGGACGQLC